MRKKKPVISNTGKFFCFNNNVSNLYNNNVFENINGMAYVFTLLMFRKPNKTTINKNKTKNCHRSTSFRFSFIYRYFKVFPQAHGAWISFPPPPFSLLPHFLSKFSYKSFLFQNFHSHSFFLHLTISVDVIHHE